MANGLWRVGLFILAGVILGCSGNDSSGGGGFFSGGAATGGTATAGASSGGATSQGGASAVEVMGPSTVNATEVQLCFDPDTESYFLAASCPVVYVGLWVPGDAYFLAPWVDSTIDFASHGTLLENPARLTELPLDTEVTIRLSFEPDADSAVTTLEIPFTMTSTGVTAGPVIRL